MKRLLLCCGAIIAIPLWASAQGWRGIVPLQSRCDDVKRILGIDGCRSGTYQTDDGTVSISFSDATCESGWNVPPGTVLSFHVHSRTQQTLASIVSDASKYIKSVDTHVRYVAYYENKDEGVSIAVFEDGTVANVFYGPSAKDSALRCPSLVSNAATLPLASKKVDEFGVLTKKDEELRVNNFATALNAWTDVSGYIVAYTGRRDGADGLSRAARIKAYLVNQGVPDARLSIVDGGIKEESTIELHIVVKSQKP